MRVTLVVFAAFVMFLTSGCSNKNAPIDIYLSIATATIDSAKINEAVSNFHMLLDVKRFDEIYQSADVDFRKNTNEQQFVALLMSVQEKLGHTKATTIGASSATWGEKSTATLTYTTDFENGIATEKFVFRLRESVLLLLEYHIDSKLLSPLAR